MGTLTITSIVSEAADNLEDAAFDRWSQSQWVGYCNRAIEDVCRLKPDAYTVRGNVQLAAGPVQSLPARAHRLIRPTRNMGANGAVPGRAIHMVSLDSQQHFDANWYTEDNGTSVDDVLYDESHPLEFMVYPPANAYYIELIYAAIPETVTIDDTLPIPDIYRTPVLYFMQGYALQSNRADADFNKGNAYLGLAFSSLGLQMQNEKLLKLDR